METAQVRHDQAIFTARKKGTDVLSRLDFNLFKYKFDYMFNDWVGAGKDLQKCENARGQVLHGGSYDPSRELINDQ